jgi:hypothetical protein
MLDGHYYARIRVATSVASSLSLSLLFDCQATTMPETEMNGGGEPDAKRPKVDGIKAPAVGVATSKSWEAEHTPKTPTERSERVR